MKRERKKRRRCSNKGWEGVLLMERTHFDISIEQSLWKLFHMIQIRRFGFWVLFLGAEVEKKRRRDRWNLQAERDDILRRRRRRKKKVCEDYLHQSYRFILQE